MNRRAAKCQRVRTREQVLSRVAALLYMHTHSAAHLDDDVTRNSPLVKKKRTANIDCMDTDSAYVNMDECTRILLTTISSPYLHNSPQW